MIDVFIVEDGDGNVHDNFAPLLRCGVIPGGFEWFSGCCVFLRLCCHKFLLKMN